VATGYQRKAIFFRGFSSRNLVLARNTFITYIRPVLEYNSVVWNPSDIFLIDLIENVQRSFPKSLPSLSCLSYIERLSRLNMEPLELRRLRSDLILYYKILSYLTPLKPEEYFLIYHSKSSTRSSPIYLQRPTHSSKKTFIFFFYRHVTSFCSSSPTLFT
jgi:hypothetical protein